MYVISGGVYEDNHVNIFLETIIITFSRTDWSWHCFDFFLILEDYINIMYTFGFAVIRLQKDQYFLLHLTNYSLSNV